MGYYVGRDMDVCGCGVVVCSGICVTGTFSQLNDRTMNSLGTQCWFMLNAINNARIESMEA